MIANLAYISPISIFYSSLQERWGAYWTVDHRYIFLANFINKLIALSRIFLFLSVWGHFGFTVNVKIKIAFIRLKILGAAFHYCPEAQSDWLKCNFHFIRQRFLPSRVGIFPWYFFMNVLFNSLVGISISKRSFSVNPLKFTFVALWQGRPHNDYDSAEKLLW